MFLYSSDYIARHGRMSERVARQKFWQMVVAVEYCHARSVVQYSTVQYSTVQYSTVQMVVAVEYCHARSVDNNRSCRKCPLIQYSHSEVVL